MKTLLLLALTLAPDPEQPYARSARPAQHHDSDKAIVQGMFAHFKGSPGADACRMAQHAQAILIYDVMADRWLYTLPASDPRNGLFYQCTALSATPDPAGAFHRYVFETRHANGAPAQGQAISVAVWPDAYYFSYVWGSGGQVCGYERPAMLAGLPAAGRCVDFSGAERTPRVRTCTSD